MTWDNSYNRHNQFDYRSDNLSDDSNCRNSPWSSYQRNEKTFWCSLTQFSECSSIRKRFHNFIQTIFILPSCFHFEEKGKEKYAMKKQQMKIILSEGGTFFLCFARFDQSNFFAPFSFTRALEMLSRCLLIHPLIHPLFDFPQETLSCKRRALSEHWRRERILCIIQDFCDISPRWWLREEKFNWESELVM